MAALRVDAGHPVFVWKNRRWQEAVFVGNAGARKCVVALCSPQAAPPAPDPRQRRLKFLNALAENRTLARTSEIALAAHNGTKRVLTLRQQRELAELRRCTFDETPKSVAQTSITEITVPAERVAFSVDGVFVNQPVYVRLKKQYFPAQIVELLNEGMLRLAVWGGSRKKQVVTTPRKLRFDLNSIQPRALRRQAIRSKPAPFDIDSWLQKDLSPQTLIAALKCRGMAPQDIVRTLFSTRARLRRWAGRIEPRCLTMPGARPTKGRAHDVALIDLIIALNRNGIVPEYADLRAAGVRVYDLLFAMDGFNARAGGRFAKTLDFRDLKVSGLPSDFPRNFLTDTVDSPLFEAFDPDDDIE